MTGEFIVETIDTQQKYKLVAIHPNRTIEWTSDYRSEETKTLHSSRIELARDVWLGYKIEVANHSSSESDSQELKLEILYPARDVSIGGIYSSKTDSFETDLTIDWMKKLETNDGEQEDEDSEDKMSETLQKPMTVKASFRWNDLEKTNDRKDHQKVVLALKHPSFENDVTLQVCFV